MKITLVVDMEMEDVLTKMEVSIAQNVEQECHQDGALLVAKAAMIDGIRKQEKMKGNMITMRKKNNLCLLST